MSIVYCLSKEMDLTKDMKLNKIEKMRYPVIAIMTDFFKKRFLEMVLQQQIN